MTFISLFKENEEPCLDENGNILPKKDSKVSEEGPTLKDEDSALEDEGKLNEVNSFDFDRD